MGDEEVKLFGTWSSPYSRRIELALKLKGIPFEYKEEDLRNKSPLLLSYNPVHKKIPVFVHNGKAIPESLVILEYIDETWKDIPILPSDPYDKAKARFWAKFIDDKILTAARNARQQGERGYEELTELLKLLENELNGKDFFGGESIGYVDIVANVVAFWFVVTQEVMGVELLTKDKFPMLFKWIDKLLDIDVVNECRPPREKHLAYVRAHLEALKIAPK